MNVELYLHAFIHLYGGEKTERLKFFVVLLVLDIGADHSSQSRGDRVKRSEMRSMRFDCYDPHLYYYSRPRKSR